MTPSPRYQLVQYSKEGSCSYFLPVSNAKPPSRSKLHLLAPGDLPRSQTCYGRAIGCRDHGSRYSQSQSPRHRRSGCLAVPGMEVLALQYAAQQLRPTLDICAEPPRSITPQIVAPGGSCFPHDAGRRYRNDTEALACVKMASPCPLLWVCSIARTNSRCMRMSTSSPRLYASTREDHDPSARKVHKRFSSEGLPAPRAPPEAPPTFRATSVSYSSFAV